MCLPHRLSRDDGHTDFFKVRIAAACSNTNLTMHATECPDLIVDRSHPAHQKYNTELIVQLILMLRREIFRYKLNH